MSFNQVWQCRELGRGLSCGQHTHDCAPRPTFIGSGRSATSVPLRLISATWKCRQARLGPWDEDIRCGYFRDKPKESLKQKQPDVQNQSVAQTRHNVCISLSHPLGMQDKSLRKVLSPWRQKCCMAFRGNWNGLSVIPNVTKLQSEGWGFQVS